MDQGVGARIRYFRTHKGFDQIQLGEMSGLTQVAISRIERGTVRKISADVLRRIAVALSVEMEVLTGDQPSGSFLAGGPEAQNVADGMLDEIAQIFRELPDADREVLYVEAQKIKAAWLARVRLLQLGSKMRI